MGERRVSVTFPNMRPRVKLVFDRNASPCARRMKQTGGTFDGGFTGYDDPATQVDQATKNVKQIREEAEARLEVICKVTIFIAGRTFRQPVHETVGWHLKGVFPVGTGLIVDGFANPRVLMEVDVEAVVSCPPGTTLGGSVR